MKGKRPTASRAVLRARPLLIGALITSLAVVGLGSSGGFSPPAGAVMANPEGGKGRFENVIDWIDWSGATNTERKTVEGVANDVLNDGGTSVVWSTPTKVIEGYWRASRCTMSEVSSRYETRDRNGRVTSVNSDGIGLGYESGTWRGDGLARLYNDGRNYRDGELVNNRQRKSGLAIGMVNVRNGQGGLSANVYAKFDCQSYLVESATQPAKNAIDALPKRKLAMTGMVYADAESPNWFVDNDPMYSQRESITVDPVPMDGHTDADVDFRLLETLRSPDCRTSYWAGDASFDYPSGTRQGVRMRSSDRECTYGPTAVTFMSNARGGYLELKGGGKSAVAIGTVSFVDHGDAPQSYGLAASVFYPEWEGGLLGGNGPKDIRPSGNPPVETDGNWYDLTAASEGRDKRVASAPRATVRLGALTDPDRQPMSSTDSLRDDNTDAMSKPGGTSDEDAVPGWDKRVDTAPGITWTREVVCGGKGNVAGWMDWNVNGAFETNERSDVVACGADGKASLSFVVPEDVQRPGAAGVSTFMRLRIEGEENADGTIKTPEPTGLSLLGEVEDHAVTLVAVPMLEVVKVVADPDGVADTLLDKDKWTLKAVQQGKTVGSGPGGFSPVKVAAGVVELSETSMHASALGYELAASQCQKHPRSPDGYTSTYDAASRRLTVRNNDWIKCTLTNQPRKGELVWSKVEADGTVIETASAPGVPGLEGSKWTLAGPQVSAGTEVEDCTSPGCQGLDKDERPGRFKVTDLKWGSYTVQEAQAPTGYELDATARQFTTIEATNLTGELKAADGINSGGVVNVRSKGSVAWSKTDGGSKKPLAGSSWSLSGPGVPVSHVVKDCEAAPCSTEALQDTDPAPGAFRVEGLAWSDESYALSEKAAPVGYKLSKQSHGFKIKQAALHHAFADAFTNDKTDVPGLPLTGGLGADAFLIGGGALAALAMLVGLVRRRRTLRPYRNLNS